MFVFKKDEDITSCQECSNLKKLPRTKYFPEQFYCTKQGISAPEFCEQTPMYAIIHQCDTCTLLGKKTDKNGFQYFTCLSPKNTRLFGQWVKSVTGHAYCWPNAICNFKQDIQR